MTKKRLGQVVTGWGFAIVGLVACSDHGYVTSTSTGAIPAELASSRQERGDHVFDYLLRHNVIGTPTDYAGATSDWPVDKPQSDLSDTELEEAVLESGGRVFVGFKHPEAARLSETATETNGRRVASIAPVDRTIIEQGRAAIKTEGGRIIRPYRHLPFVVAIVDPGAATVLRRNPVVSWIEPVVRFKLGNATVPDNLSQIRAPDAWPVTKGDGARVWIVDSGTAGGYQSHADLPPLSPNTCLSFTSWYPDCESPNDFPEYGHGTEVAGVALAKGVSDLYGVAPNVSLYGSAKLCGGTGGQGGCGDIFTFVYSVTDVLEYLRQNGLPDIINMSFGWGPFSQAVAIAAQEAYDAGDLLVAPAGNVSQTGSTVSYPGRYSSVIAVSGLNADDTFWNGSASGPEVELSAPACVQTLEGVSGTKVVCGTSYAAPAASGVAALVWSEKPGWTNTQVRSWLQSSALDLGITGRDNQFGYGRVDACRAVVSGCIPLPPPPLDIQIFGPDEIEPTSTCTWEAHLLNGTPPFSYYWSGQIQPQGTNSPYYTGGMDPAQSGSAFTIRVDVSDSAGSSGWADLSITEDPLAPACVQFAQRSWSVR